MAGYIGSKAVSLSTTAADVDGDITVSGTVDGRDVAADGVTADAALPKSGGTLTGALGIGAAPNATLTLSDGTDEFDFGVTANQLLIKTVTSDGADDQRILIDAGNGGQSSARGAYIALAGNEASSEAGHAIYQMGNVSGSSHVFRKAGGSDAVTIDASGNVGLGVTDPDAALDISKGSNSLGVLRVTQRASGAAAYGLDVGLDPTTGDPVFSRIVNDTVSESFRIQRSTGNVLIGKSSGSTDSFLQPSGSSSKTSLRFDNNYGTGLVCLVNNSGNATYSAFLFENGGSAKGSIVVSASGTTYNATSDRRLKDNIQPIADATDKLMAMNPVTHTWIANPEEDAVHGFIAQEMQEIIPEAVSGDPDGEEMMSMDYGRITPVLTAALQDAHKKIEALEARINEMEAK